MHQKPINNIIKQLEDYFLTGLEYATEDFSSDEKEILSHFFLTVFNKWNYSAILSNTALTPANIINSGNRQCEVHKLLPTCQINSNQVEFKLVVNSLSQHQFIKDLKTVADYFVPASPMPDFSCSPVAIPNEIVEKGRIYDHFYFSYLILMLKELCLITPMSSIGIKMYQKDEENASLFFSNDIKAILQKIVAAALHLFEKHTFESLFFNNLMSGDYMVDILSKTNTLDDILEIVYKNSDYNFKEMLEMAEEENLSFDNETLLSSVYYVGMLFDKWFFTPLGSYLDLIAPIYIEPYNYKEEADYLRPFLLTECDMSSEFFSPCNYFYVTKLGEAILNIKNFDSNLPLADTTFSEEQLFTMLITQKSGKDKKHKQITYNNMMTLSIELKGNKALWKAIEIPNSFKLIKLQQAIVYLFGIDPSAADYFSMIDKTDSSNKNTIINFKSFQLKDIDFRKYDLMFKSNQAQLKITLTDIKKGKFQGEYPKLICQSKEITYLERNDNL